ncbi:MAG: hypothetical protein ACP5I7_05685 [Sulfolobales archaeon]|jgi:hypothetical protein
MSRFRIGREELIRMIKKAQSLYNKYRSPEAKAEIISFSKDILIVRFDGSFCETCGINDWIDDFRYILRDLGVETVIERIEEVDEYIRIAYFRILGKNRTHNIN